MGMWRGATRRISDRRSTTQARRHIAGLNRKGAKGAETSQRRNAETSQLLSGRRGPSKPFDYRRNYSVAGRTREDGSKPKLNLQAPLPFPRGRSISKLWVPTQKKCDVLCDGLSAFAPLRFKLRCRGDRVQSISCPTTASIRQPPLTLARMTAPASEN